MYRTITKENWRSYAYKNYETTSLDIDKEFNEDLKRFKYIKRLLRRFKQTKELKVRLILNHIIVLQNVFGLDAACTLLFYKVEPEFWPMLKSFLVFLNYIRDDEMIKIKHDQNILNELRKI
jgi:hypothetical protein